MCWVLKSTNMPLNWPALTVWIGELQWRLQNGYPFKLYPVLTRWIRLSVAMH